MRARASDGVNVSAQCGVQIGTSFAHRPVRHAAVFYCRPNFPGAQRLAGIAAAKSRRVQTNRADQRRRSSADHALFLRMTLIDICCGPPGELRIP
jgi:hypothetical protein